jgi:type II secretory pathway pseudopilin PulG
MNKNTKIVVVIVIIVATVGMLVLMVDVHFQDQRLTEAREKLCRAVLIDQGNYDNYPECQKQNSN